MLTLKPGNTPADSEVKPSFLSGVLNGFSKAKDTYIKNNQKAIERYQEYGPEIASNYTASQFNQPILQGILNKMATNYQPTSKVGNVVKNVTTSLTQDASQPIREKIDRGETLTEQDKNILFQDSLSPVVGLIGGVNAKGYKDSTKFSSLLDKKPRFEIDDSGAKLKPQENWFNKAYNEGANLHEVIDHKELYKQYPDLQGITVKISNQGGGGSYDPSMETINISQSALKDKSTLLHEIQHAIQEVEGFAKGGSPDTMAQNNTVLKQAYESQFRELESKLSKAKTPEESIEIETKLEELDNKIASLTDDGINAYKRLSGELEARAVQRRMDMPMDQRLKTDPYSAEAMATTGTTNPKDFITRFDGGMSQSVDSKLRPLYEEARNYKSAEQFVKAQGQPVFHGTASNFEVFDPKFLGYSTNAESAKGAFWFTDDPATAKAYAVYAAEDAPVQRLLKEADKMEKLAQKTKDKKYWDMYDDLVRKSEEMATYDNTFERRKKLANVKQAYVKGDFFEVDAKGKTPQELSNDDNIDSWLNNQIKKAKKSGKVGLKITNIDDAVGLYNRPSTHYAVFNPDNIKTKSQLTDIWNKANKI